MSATRQDTVSIPRRNGSSASRKTITPGAVTRGERNETALRFSQPRYPFGRGVRMTSGPNRH